VLGSERTMDQDPLFAFRILADIAIKALSKAINDPTTAVLAIDQLHRLLRSAGTRQLLRSKSPPTSWCRSTQFSLGQKLKLKPPSNTNALVTPEMEDSR